MKFVLKTVKQSQRQPENRDPTRYVRKHWSLFVAYYVATSVTIGIGIAFFTGK